jgi:hypothetical protein
VSLLPLSEHGGHSWNYRRPDPVAIDPKLLRQPSQRSNSVECDDQRRLLLHFVLVVLAVKQRYYYQSSFFAA